MKSQNALTALAIFALLAARANGEQPVSGGPTDQETIRVLVQQVKELQDKVAALEGKLIVPAAKVMPGPSSVEPTIGSSGGGLPAVPEPSTNFQESHDVRGIRWQGFGEVSYKVLDQRQPELGTFGFVPGSAGNFYTGDFDLFLRSKLTEKSSVLAELVIGERDAQRFDVELARALLKYDYNDHLRVSVGRYHTGIGYYNTAFLSGRWLQTTADRPLVMEFAADGGLLPTQALGISVTGEIPAGGLGLNYIAEYGSSDTLRSDPNGNDDVDENNGNHVNLGFFLRPERVPGLRVGGSVYHDRISDFLKGPSVRLGQTIVNGHLVYVGHGIEFLNEAFLIRNAYEDGGPVYNMPAFYTQFSRGFGGLRPFFRYQYANTNLNSSYHDDVLLRYGPSVGVRFDLNESVAFKIQLDHTIRKSRNDLNGLQMQVSFAF